MQYNYTIQTTPAGAEQTQVNRFVMAWEYSLISFLDTANINWSWFEAGTQWEQPWVEIIFTSNDPETWVNNLEEQFAQYKLDNRTHGEGEE